MSGTNGSGKPHASFLRSVLALTGSVMLVALLLAPFAAVRTGSGGIGGLALAAGICLVAGWVAEALAALLHDRVMPLAVMLLGMAIRMLPPLGICVALAAQGISGRANMAFIFYLLAFYLVTLALETWLTVSRLANSNSSIPRIAR